MQGNDLLERTTGPLDELERYWRGLSQKGQLPCRTEIDPARIDHALPHAFVLEKIAPGIGRMRVAGQALCDLLGMEVRGMPLSAFFGPQARTELDGWLRQLWSGPALVDLPVAVPRTLGHSRLPGRLLLLPLADEAGAVTRALGGLYFGARPSQSGRQIIFGPMEQARWEPALPQGFEPRLVTDNTSPAPRPGPAPAAQRPALRLVVGGRS